MTADWGPAARAGAGTGPAAASTRPGVVRGSTERSRVMSRAVAGMAALALVLAIGLVAPHPANAASLDQMRAQGLVCERPDGLLQALSGDAGVRQAVASINRQRLATYEKLARQNNATVEQTRVVAGRKLQAKYGGCR